MLESAPGVERVRLAHQDGDHATFEVHAADGKDLRETLAARVLQNGWGLRTLDLRRTTLEDRFIQAVGRTVAGSPAADVDPNSGSDTDPEHALEAV
jgi:ABC-2 type transport system ATP-binding protein